MQDAVGAVRVRGADELRALVGRDLGPSEWFEVTQEVVDTFGRAVADWHWAHNDPARAARGPLGGPIGHAHLTLSLVPHLRKSLVAFATGECMFYGYNRVRFPTAVPVGARVRMRGAVAQVDAVSGGEQLTLDVRVAIEGLERPACVAQAIWRHYDVEAPG
jgi:acyl dehydratase